MRIYFRWGTTITGCVLAGLMLVASHWQYRRYLAKEAYIERMRDRLQAPVVELETLAGAPGVDWSSLPYRRVKVSGSFDFSHEVALRNRRYGKDSGVYVLTPLRMDNAPETFVLVNRGFVPLAKSDREARKAFHKPERLEFTALVKEPMTRKWFAPKDPPTGPGLPWVDQWLRVDLKNLEKQLPYAILPIWLEIMETPESKGVEEKIVTSTAGRDELFFLPGKDAELATLKPDLSLNYPLPVFDSVIPPGRHFGYIFEWAAMAFFTLVATFLLQLRAPPHMRSDRSAI